MTEHHHSDPESEYAYRFQYADESAFEVYADGRAFIVTKNGRREQKFGKIDNRIPLLIGMAAKPRQIDQERFCIAFAWAYGTELEKSHYDGRTPDDGLTPESLWEKATDEEREFMRRVVKAAFAGCPLKPEG